MTTFFCPTIRLSGITVLSAALAAAQSTTGTWTLYPPQATTYQTLVQQPINADGSSNFKDTGKSVIPVKFRLASAPGPVIFQSIFSDGQDADAATTNDYSYLSFALVSPLTFSQIHTLSAVYNFSEGNCGGGSLRWSVRVDIGNDGNTANDGSVFIYYGGHPNFTECITAGSATNQSGINMIGRPELRYDTSQVGGTFYDSYANAVALVGSLRVLRASLVLDSGWFNNTDQKLTPSNVTVNDNTFVPQSGTLTPVCPSSPATIQITKTAGTPTGNVNEPISVQPEDNNSLFRIVDCQYMYNLATSSLSGAGTYQVGAIIGGNAAAGPARFDLR